VQDLLNTTSQKTRVNASDVVGSDRRGLDTGANTFADGQRAGH